MIGESVQEMIRRRVDLEVAARLWEQVGAEFETLVWPHVWGRVEELVGFPVFESVFWQVMGLILKERQRQARARSARA